MSDKKRLLEIKQFLAEKCGVKNFTIEKMSLDASSRQYYRIFFNDGSTKIILDDKNHKNKSKEFVSLSSFLRKNDIIAPKIFGGANAKTSVEGSGFDKIADSIKLKNITTNMVDNDICITAYVDKEIWGDDLCLQV